MCTRELSKKSENLDIGFWKLWLINLILYQGNLGWKQSHIIIMDDVYKYTKLTSGKKLIS